MATAGPPPAAGVASVTVGQRRARAQDPQSDGRRVRARPEPPTEDAAALLRERDLLRRQVEISHAVVAAERVKALPRYSMHSRFEVVAVGQREGIFAHFDRELRRTAKAHAYNRKPPVGLPPPLLANLGRLLPRQGLPPLQGAPPKLTLVRVDKILNPRLQEKYLSELQDIAGLCGGRVTNLPAIDALPVESFNRQPLNEYLMFHGAKAQLIEQLQRQGFDPRLANAGSMFGMGTYFATNCSKSDLYTEPNDAGERCLLVARVCLGEPHRATQADRSLSLPPPRTSGNQGRLNSVIGLTRSQGGVLQHPEYIVYKDTQSLPQYSLWYKHAADCKCTQCLHVVVSIPHSTSPMETRHTRCRLPVGPDDTLETVQKLIMLQYANVAATAGVSTDDFVSGSCRVVLKQVPTGGAGAQMASMDRGQLATHAQGVRPIFPGRTAGTGQLRYTAHATLRSQGVTNEATLLLTFERKPPEALAAGSEWQWCDASQAWRRPLAQVALRVLMPNTPTAALSSISLRVPSNTTTVLAVKRALETNLLLRDHGGNGRLHTATHFVAQQRLIYAGRELANDRTLAHYGIRAPIATIHLVPRATTNAPRADSEDDLAALYANERNF
jgi:hypothetical protein